MPQEEFRRAGQARHRITIVDPQSATQWQDSYGQITYDSPPTIGSFWGYMEPAAGRLLESPMGQRWAEDHFIFTMRYHRDVEIKREMHVQFGGQTYVIVDINDTTNSLRPVTVLILRRYEQ